MRGAAGLSLIAFLALAAAGCGANTPSATVTAVSPAVAPSVPTSASPSVPASQVPTDAPGSSGPAGGVVEDPSLLDLLPADVDGVPVGPEHQAFLDAATDPAFAQNVRRAAFGVAVDGTDLVSGVVAELEPVRFSDGFFRDWRDSYNEGACGQAGGVIGNAESQIDGRTVYIASCAGGLRTYHVWVPERGAIVSAFALGEKRLGETLMDGLRP